MRSEPNLDKRHREVLSAIVRHYIAKGLPVGSRTVASETGQSLSSATIRSVMAHLESEGFLEQPHTSAGRVPTDMAYRYYVDRLMQMAQLTPALAKFIEKNLGGDEVPNEQLMARASHVLSEVSSNVGLALGPALEEKLLEHIKFIKLPDHRILVVIVSKPDLIENKVLRLADDISQEELDRSAAYLNAEFRGWSLRTIRLKLFKKIEEARELFDHLLQSVARLMMEGALGHDELAPLFVEGTARILEQPEFEDVHKIRQLLLAFEEKAKLIEILGSLLHSSSPGVQVVIGTENPADEMRHCALVIAPLRYGSRIVGALGVVGPTRMEYDRAVTTVEYVAHLCNRLLSVN
ncbi:MAG: heat-inducible transcription repressor HrcA [Acidobacteria bacterium]|nr:MAG: heat-inducible transcription repressor HrcA [Acidobacteriota bacterium]